MNENGRFEWERREEQFVMKMKTVCVGDKGTQELYDSWLWSKELIRVKDLKTGLDLHHDLRCSLGKEEPGCPGQ